MNKTSFIRKIASALLLLCFVLPLSKCAAVRPPDQASTPPDVYHYPYKMLQESVQGFFTERDQIINNAFSAIIIFCTFFIPVISFLLKPLHQNILILIGSMPSALFFAAEVYFHTPLIGFWLASLCWLMLVSISLLAILQHFPHNKLLKAARSLYSLAGRGLRRAP